MSSVVKVIMPLPAFFSPAPATATGLRSTVPVRAVAAGRPFQARTATARVSSASIRATTTRTTATATTGFRFAPSKGSLNSERSGRILFFNCNENASLHLRHHEPRHVGRVCDRQARSHSREMADCGEFASRAGARLRVAGGVAGAAAVPPQVIEEVVSDRVLVHGGAEHRRGLVSQG